MLDTHIFIWWLLSDKRLKNSWQQLIADPGNLIFVSLVSAWEMAIKLKMGKLRLKKTLEECFRDQDFEMLGISLQHIVSLNRLPLKHKDPFDRMLIAQAKVEHCRLITDDQKIKKYRIRVLD